MELFHERGDIEPVDKKRGSSCPVCVGEEVEELEATWIGLYRLLSGLCLGQRLCEKETNKVGIVCVSPES